MWSTVAGPGRRGCATKERSGVEIPPPDAGQTPSRRKGYGRREGRPSGGEPPPGRVRGLSAIGP